MSQDFSAVIRRKGSIQVISSTDYLPLRTAGSTDEIA